MKKVLIIFTILIFIILALGIIFILFERTKESVTIKAFNEAYAEKIKPGGVSILSWDIDHLSVNNPKISIDKISKFFIKQEADICFVQDVDVFSKRSEKNNQAEILADKLSEYSSYLGININSFLLSGRIKAGLLSMTRYLPLKTTKIILDNKKTYFKTYKNTILVTELGSAIKDKNWYFINIDFSKTDSRQNEPALENLNRYITDLFSDGHYVVVGGNWGNSLPGVNQKDFSSGTFENEAQNAEWVSDGWQWCYDDSCPTFQINKNVFAITDGFLVSPNLRVDVVRGFDTGFKYSNHNPVLITVSIQ